MVAPDTPAHLSSMGNVMPSTTPANYVAATRGYGGTVAAPMVKALMTTWFRGTAAATTTSTAGG